MSQAFASLLEKSFQTEMKPGSVVCGEIVKLERDGLTVDIGGKCEGFVPMKEIPGCYNAEDVRKSYEPGQVREFFILKDFEEENQHYLLSLRRVIAFKNWDRLAEMKEANETVEITVTSVTKGGILVNVIGLKGFVPASQLRLAKPLNELIGEVLPAKILEVDKNKNKLILSHRMAIFQEKAALRAETLNRLHEGDIVEGEIVKITDFGVFVDINGIDGLLPLSEISWKRIKHPSEILELGQRITIRVLTVDKELQRISLSLKRMEQDPWETVNSLFRVGERVNGRISKMLSSGVLAELVPGIEAYCAYDANNRFFAMDQFYEFEITAMSAHERRITVRFIREVEAPKAAQAEDREPALV
jgi:ribosomal protein S1